MKKFFSFIVNNRILILIIILAGTLRFTGINPGYPPYHSDEGITYSAATSMIKNGNIDPLRYDYPALVPLINALFYKFFFIPIQWTNFYLSNINQIRDGSLELPLEKRAYKKIFQEEILGNREVHALAWSRSITALFGIGVVLLTYFLATSLFNQKVGLLAAFLTSINYREVLNSHLGLPDIYNAFFVLAATLSSIYLWKKPSGIKYALTAIFVALSFSTKYQLFALFPLILVHFYKANEQKTIRAKIKYLLRWEIFLIPLITAIIFIILNPYHIVNYKETLEQIHNVSLKYGVGHQSFYLYPFSYLFHIGIGKITSILILVGVLISCTELKKSMVLLSVIIPFFLATTYYSTGGFYTRNFVTVIPLLLIFAGLIISKLLVSKHFFSYLIFIIIIILTTRENLSNSIIVAREYTKPWNYKIISSWIEKNIPIGSKVAAHPSVTLPDKGMERIPFEHYEYFSVEEFREAGANYSAVNFDTATSVFYDWMTQSGQTIQYWEKPVTILEQTYGAIALRELSQSAIYSIMKPWQAPDSNFMAVKIPNYIVSYTKEIMVYNFTGNKGNQGWQTEGNIRGKVQLSSQEKGLSIGSEAVGEDIIRWQAPSIEVDQAPGFKILAKVKTESSLSKLRSGYIVASFYQTKEDAKNSINRVGVRISSRVDRVGEMEISLIGQIPEKARYLNIEFRNFNPSETTTYLSSLAFYSADVQVDYGGVKITPIDIDDNILFPNSHGNL